MRSVTARTLLHTSLLGATMLAPAGHALAQAIPTIIGGNNGTYPLPTGQYVTPMGIFGATQQPLNPRLPLYPNFVAGEAVRMQLSPSGGTLAIITAGQNSLDNPTTGKLDTAASTQFIFLYDVSGFNVRRPVLQQVIQQTNAHIGLVWAPDGGTLYTSGGADDVVYAYTIGGDGRFARTAKIALNHGNKGIGLGVRPNASGLALSADGATLVVTNNYNDSISVIDTASRTVIAEHDLRPYAAGNEGTSGVAGGEYPLAAAFRGNDIVYVGSYRDRQVAVVNLTDRRAPKVTARIALDGNANGMTLDADQATLYVAQDNTDEVAVIATATNTVVREIDTRAPIGLLTGAHYTGASPFAVTISPDGNTLFAVNDGANSVAVIPLTGSGANTVVGLIPTPYAPKDVAFSADGAQMFIINGKSDTGGNPGHLTGATARLTTTTYPGGNAAAATAANATNQYQFQLEQSSLVSAPVPSIAALSDLTGQVAANNFYGATLSSAEQATMTFLRSHIRHVIYIVKENRTYDQVLGDLGNGGNGDPSLTVFGKAITPNFHSLAANFVTLDNYFDAGDGSMDGWSLATRGRVTTTEEITQQLNYAFVDRGLSYESEGANRNVPVLPTTAARDAASGNLFSSLSASLPGGTANLQPGAADVSATDAPYGIQQGFIWNAVLQAGGTVRNYGFLTNNIGPTTNGTTPVINRGTGTGTVQVAALNPALVPFTDVYFRGYDQAYPDLWRYYEWKGEFDSYAAKGNLPNLQTVRFSHDHMGAFGTALAGLTTPEAQQGDDDYAVGSLVQAVANSPFAKDTLVIVTEDDSQDGPDHVDSHRTTTYVVGPYVKQRAVVSTRYNQVSLLRTIEDILGSPHINLNTAFQRPMVEVFDTTLDPANWTFAAAPSTILRGTTVFADSGRIRFAEGADVVPAHDGAYWAEATKGYDWSVADRMPYGAFNRLLWEGLMPGQPYPLKSGMMPAVAHKDDDDDGK